MFSVTLKVLTKQSATEMVDDLQSRLSHYLLRPL